MKSFGFPLKRQIFNTYKFQKFGFFDEFNEICRRNKKKQSEVDLSNFDLKIPLKFENGEHTILNYDKNFVKTLQVYRHVLDVLSVLSTAFLIKCIYLKKIFASLIWTPLTLILICSAITQFRRLRYYITEIKLLEDGRRIKLHLLKGVSKTVDIHSVRQLDFKEKLEFAKMYKKFKLYLPILINEEVHIIPNQMLRVSNQDLFQAVLDGRYIDFRTQRKIN